MVEKQNKGSKNTHSQQSATQEICISEDCQIGSHITPTYNPTDNRTSKQKSSN